MVLGLYTNRITSLKRFEEQKGIIDSYVERERDWKKNKILQNKEISQLKSKLSKEKNNE